jgi:predicted anti-sigma-YlaC factor YlaD
LASKPAPDLFGRLCLLGVVCALAVALPGCSIKKMAINSLGDALAEGTSTFATDDDPELVRDAVPFALKTIETLIVESPKHRGLLLSACSGFTQYGYAFLQQEADLIESQDLDRATAMRARARKLYLRALDYGLRGLEVDYPGLRDGLRRDPDLALAKTKTKDVPLLYWTGSAWGAAFAINKADSELSADQAIIEKLLQRALALDEAWGKGAIHDVFITWEGGRASTGGSLDRARRHFDRAIELAGGRRASPFVTFAEVVSVGTQNKQEFLQMLDRALQVDINKAPDERLANVIAQRRARWLQARIDELFVEAPEHLSGSW